MAEADDATPRRDPEAFTELDPEMGRLGDKISEHLERVNDALGGDVARHREALAAGLAGRVLDVGAGTGTLLSHVEAGRSDDLTVHLLDVDRDDLAWAATKVDDHDVDVRITGASAAALPYPDDCFDVVVAATVLCAVDDPPAVLSAVERVLRPGGEFRFLEHVDARGATGLAASVVYPVWERAVSGCDMRRVTGRTIEESDLEVVEMERCGDGLLPPWTLVTGVARPTGAGD
jgi:ubiquinone/menaquinone biosynthesis C-methylase UbiE